MTPAVRFLLDANVLIEAHRRYYAFDICPGFWDALVLHNTGGRLLSIDRVRNFELAGNDTLADWAAARTPGQFFAESTDRDIVDSYAEANRWVNAQARFPQNARAEFADSVDGWLIAYAKAKGLTLVTQEVPARQGAKIKIPDVCEAMGVRWLNTFGMLRALGSSFRLA